MRFVDEAEIEVNAGHGGAGRVSFRRESKTARGGPDGGDGGQGGDVVVKSDPGSSTLMDQRYRCRYKAANGEDGKSSCASGKSASPLEISLPPGTVVTNADTGEVLTDLSGPTTEVVVAKGGRGGRGNAFFTSSTRQAPRFAQPGEPGEKCRLSLNLKLMADVGLVGLPNAGKSTFIRAISKSKARVAGYPFTTLVPNLGVAHVDERDFVIADIPGLVKGAHEGLGLGDRFLKHLERTHVLVHLLSLSPDAPDPLEAFEIVNAELKAHSPRLAEQPCVVVLNKIDLIEDRYELELWTEAFRERGIDIMWASGLSKENMTAVLRKIVQLLDSKAAREKLSDSEGNDAEKEPWSPI